MDVGLNIPTCGFKRIKRLNIPSCGFKRFKRLNIPNCGFKRIRAMTTFGLPVLCVMMWKVCSHLEGRVLTYEYCQYLEGSPNDRKMKILTTVEVDFTENTKRET